MANAIKKTADANGLFQYVESVNTGDYPTADWEINPDVAGVAAVPRNYWKWNGSAVVEMDAGEKAAVDTALAETAAMPNAESHYNFLHWGAAKGSVWARFNFVMPSNLMPAVFANDAVVSGLTWVCYTNNADCDVQIFKNNSLHFTWSLINKRVAYKTDGLAGVTFAAGDRMSIKLVGGTQPPFYPSLAVYYRYTGSGTGEGGSSTI